VSMLWLDDRRPAPGPHWLVAKTSEEAIALLSTEQVEWISFDHDLVGDDTGMKVVDWLDRKQFDQNDYALPGYSVHSGNPVGASNIRRAMEAIYRRQDRLS